MQEAKQIQDAASDLAKYLGTNLETRNVGGHKPTCPVIWRPSTLIPRESASCGETFHFSNKENKSLKVPNTTRSGQRAFHRHRTVTVLHYNPSRLYCLIKFIPIDPSDLWTTPQSPWSRLRIPRLVRSTSLPFPRLFFSRLFSRFRLRLFACCRFSTTAR